MKTIKDYIKEDVFDVNRNPREILKGTRLNLDVYVTDVNNDTVTIKNTNHERDEWGYITISSVNISKYEEFANLGINKIIYDQNLLIILDGNKGLDFHGLCFECNNKKTITNIIIQKSLPLSNIDIKTEGALRYFSESKNPVKFSNVNIDCYFIAREKGAFPFFGKQLKIKLSSNIISPNELIFMEIQPYEYTEIMHVLQKHYDTKYLDKTLGLNNIPSRLLKNGVIVLKNGRNTYMMVNKSNSYYDAILSTEKKIWGDAYNNYATWAGDWILGELDGKIRIRLENLNII